MGVGATKQYALLTNLVSQTFLSDTFTPEQRENQLRDEFRGFVTAIKLPCTPKNTLLYINGLKQALEMLLFMITDDEELVAATQKKDDNDADAYNDKIKTILALFDFGASYIRETEKKKACTTHLYRLTVLVFELFSEWHQNKKTYSRSTILTITALFNSVSAVLENEKNRVRLNALLANELAKRRKLRKKKGVRTLKSDILVVSIGYGDRQEQLLPYFLVDAVANHNKSLTLLAFDENAAPVKIVPNLLRQLSGGLKISDADENDRKAEQLETNNLLVKANGGSSGTTAKLDVDEEEEKEKTPSAFSSREEMLKTFKAAHNQFEENIHVLPTNMYLPDNWFDLLKRRVPRDDFAILELKLKQIADLVTIQEQKMWNKIKQQLLKSKSGEFFIVCSIDGRGCLENALKTWRDKHLLEPSAVMLLPAGTVYVYKTLSDAVDGFVASEKSGVPDTQDGWQIKVTLEGISYLQTTPLNATDFNKNKRCPTGTRRTCLGEALTYNSVHAISQMPSKTNNDDENNNKNKVEFILFEPTHSSM